MSFPTPQPQHPFLEETQPNWKLRFNRPSDREPKVECETPGCGASVYLGRLPWQSRCSRCRESWSARQILSYHTQIIGQISQLPWQQHLRQRYRVVAENPTPVIPEWGSAPPPPPEPQQDFDFIPGPQKGKGKGKGKFQSDSEEEEEVPEEEKPESISVDHGTDPTLDLDQSMLEYKTECGGSSGLETKLEDYMSGKLAEAEVPEVLSKLEDLRKDLQEKYDTLAEYVDLANERLTEVAIFLDSAHEIPALAEKAREKLERTAEPRAEPSSSSTSASAPNLQSLLSQLGHMTLSEEDAEAIAQVIKKP